MSIEKTLHVYKCDRCGQVSQDDLHRWTEVKDTPLNPPDAEIVEAYHLCPACHQLFHDLLAKRLPRRRQRLRVQLWADRLLVLDCDDRVMRSQAELDPRLCKTMLTAGVVELRYFLAPDA